MPEPVEFLKSGCVRSKNISAIGQNTKDGAED